MSHRALVAEPFQSLALTLRNFLEGAGFKVMRVASFQDAIAEVQEAEPDVLFTSCGPGFDGEALSERVKQLAPHCPVVLLYPSQKEDPGRDADRAGADAYLIAPLKKGSVISCARTMVRLRSLTQQVSRLETDLRRHVADPPSDVLAGAGTSADFEFFKRFLLIEIKRSRRYKYPVSFLLVGLDAYAEKTRALSAGDRKQLLAESLSLLTRGVRDIDLAVPFVEGRFLVFLPHTARDGAVTVAIRARERLAKLEQHRGITASIGIASFEPSPNQPAISFGTLMKEATDALRKAQRSGGNRVEGGARVKRDRISIG